MATAAEHIAAIYERLIALEEIVDGLVKLGEGARMIDPLDQEIDLPLPQPSQSLSAPLKGAQGIGNGEDVDDDLSPEELAAVAAARARLANDKGTSVPATVVPEGQRSRVAGDTVELPPVSDEQREQRRLLAQAINLGDDFGQEGVEAYVKGGPLWLYYGNREYVLGLSRNVWTAMVEDVMQTSPQEATEMGRDLFKVRGSAVTREIPGWGNV